MARLIDKKLAGSTLVEVLIAMVIIVAVFSIAMQVFANVMRSGVSTTKVKVENQMRLIADQVKRSGQVESEELLLDSIRYELKVDPAVLNGLSQLEVLAIQEGNRIATYHCLFVERDEEN